MSTTTERYHLPHDHYDGYDLVCPVCLGLLACPVARSCGHALCAACHFQCEKTSSRCPTCKGEGIMAPLNKVVDAAICKVVALKKVVDDAICHALHAKTVLGNGLELDAGGAPTGGRQEESLSRLAAKVKEVYSRCGFDVSTSPSTLFMLSELEARLEDLLAKIETFCQVSTLRNLDA